MSYLLSFPSTSSAVGDTGSISPRRPPHRRRPRATRRQRPRPRTTAASRVGRGHNERLRSRAGLHRHRAPRDRPHHAVERQFAHEREAVELLGRDLPRGDEDADRDGQVERARVLPQVRGREVDDRAAGREPVAEVHHRAFDAVDALAHGEFGQPHEHDLGHVRRCRVHLHFNRYRVDADEREGAELGEHDRPRAEGKR